MDVQEIIISAPLIKYQICSSKAPTNKTRTTIIIIITSLSLSLPLWVSTTENNQSHHHRHDWYKASAPSVIAIKNLKTVLFDLFIFYSYLQSVCFMTQMAQCRLILLFAAISSLLGLLDASAGDSDPIYK